MDLELREEDLAFREEVRTFLDTNLTPELRAAGARTTSVFCEPRYTLPWQRILHARGWAAPSWPKEYGGPGWSEVQRSTFAANQAYVNGRLRRTLAMAAMLPWMVIKFGNPDSAAAMAQSLSVP